MSANTHPKPQREALNFYRDDAEGCGQGTAMEKASALVAATESELIKAAVPLSSQSPIQRLPEEIFAEIVAQSLGLIRHSPSKFDSIHPTTAYYIQLYRFRHVATSWKELIDSTPQFWTEISSFCPPNVVWIALVKSAEAPLHITLGNPIQRGPDLSFLSSAPRTSESKTTTLDTFWSYAGPQIPRWKSASFHFLPNPTPIAQKFLVNPVPLLERVQITRMEDFGPEFSSVTAVDLFGGQAESLKELSIRSFPILWESPLLRQVEVLTIEGRGLNIKIQQLVDILRDNGKLRDLTLNIIVDDEDEAFTPDETFTIPNLEKIHIPDVTTVLIEFVLTRLDAPRCACISIGIRNHVFLSAETGRRGFIAIENRLRNSLAAGPISTVQLFKTEISGLRAVWEVPGLNTPEAPKFNLRLTSWSAESGCAWFEDLLGEVGRQVRLRLEPVRNLSFQGDMEFIAKLTAVRSITITTDTFAFFTAISLLTRSFKTEHGGPPRRYFSQLHEIVLSYSRGVDMRLKEAILERYDPGRLPGIEVAPELTLDFRPTHALTEADWNIGRLFTGLCGVKAVTMQGVPIESV